MFAVTLGRMNNVVSVPDAAFYGLFSSIQLIEYFLWRNLGHTEFWSHVGLLVILLQPLVSLTRIGPLNDRYAMMAAYMFFVGLVLSTQTIDFTTTKGSNGHLVWNWLNFPTAILATFVAFQLFSTLYNGKIGHFTAYLAVILAIYWTYQKSGTWGSMWCWISNFLGLMYLAKVFSKSTCA